MSCCFGFIPKSSNSTTAAAGNKPGKIGFVRRLWQKIAAVCNSATQPETLFLLGVSSVGLGFFIAANLRGVEGIAIGSICVLTGGVLLLGAGVCYAIRHCFGCHQKSNEENTPSTP